MKLPFDEKCITFWWNAAHTHIFAFIVACNTHNFQCIIRYEHVLNTHMPAVSIIFPREHLVLLSLSLTTHKFSRDTFKIFACGDLCGYCFYFRFREKKTHSAEKHSKLNGNDAWHQMYTRETVIGKGERWLTESREHVKQRTRWERNATEANERETHSKLLNNLMTTDEFRGKISAQTVFRLIGNWDGIARNWNGFFFFFHLDENFTNQWHQ